MHEAKFGSRVGATGVGGDSEIVGKLHGGEAIHLWKKGGGGVMCVCVWEGGGVDSGSGILLPGL